PVEASLDGGGHVAAHRFAVDRRQPLDRARALVLQPQPEHFSDLVHTNLPEHGHLPGPLVGQVAESTGSGAAAGGSRGGPITGGRVFPCCGASTTPPTSCGTHLKVVPSR